jgi:TRAP-type C4-dicarboxylate transport system permease small subunit
MLRRVNDILARITEFALWTGFLALMVTVGLQVVARNVFAIPLIWTLDLAQLLFSWLVFIGAALALRRGAHYMVDLWPENLWPPFDMALRVIGILAGAIVIYVLVRYGSLLVGIRQTSTVQSLGISRAWMFMPMPVGGILMLLFLIELAWDSLRRPGTA